MTGVSSAECYAMRYLYLDGWEVAEIAFALERSESTVNRHLRDRCVKHAGLLAEPPKELGELPDPGTSVPE